MTSLTLRGAAQHTGTKPSTILRAILSGKLGFSRDSDGAYEFDPDELERVFAPDRRADHVPLAQLRVIAHPAADGEAGSL
ncbi:MAG: hypothetical protein JNM20_19300 [Rhizobiales bacterium]|nr:hypothetical protein [Hyphomicrobiales bacterium]